MNHQSYQLNIGALCRQQENLGSWHFNRVCVK